MANARSPFSSSSVGILFVFSFGSRLTKEVGQNCYEMIKTLRTRGIEMKYWSSGHARQWTSLTTVAVAQTWTLSSNFIMAKVKVALL